MKRKIQNEYIYWGITALSVIALGILFYFTILRFDNIIKIIGKILYIFRPLLYGIIIAFILTQSFNFFNRKFRDGNAALCYNEDNNVRKG